MVDLSMIQALSIWSDLDDAYHGCSSFGGDTAEIYMYRLMHHDPIVVSDDGRRARIEQVNRACESLYSLLDHFATRRACKVVVNGRPIGPWIATMGQEHRVSVCIKRAGAAKSSNDDQIKRCLDKSLPLAVRLRAMAEADLPAWVKQILFETATDLAIITSAREDGGR